MRKTLLHLLAFGPVAALAQQSGSLDLNFGSNGIASIDFPSNFDDRGQCVLVQPDGRILMAGGSYQANGVKFAIARLMTNGTLDNTFGTSGRATAQAGSPPNLDDIIYAMALQPDGKIVAAGRTFATGLGYRAVVLRFNANGTIDNTFGTNGIRVDDIAPGNEDCYYGVAVQADGKIVAGGLAKSSSDFDVVVARYNANGTPDATYGTNGFAILDIGGVDNRGSAMVLQPDGKVVVAGTHGNPAVDSDFLLARFTTTGAPDATFGTGGSVISAFSPSTDWAYGLALQPDGKLVAAGMVTNGAAANVGVARYLTNGTLDTTFDGDGLAINAFSAACYARAVAVLPDGRIVTGGNTLLSMLIVMFNANGSPDLNFSFDAVESPVLGGNAFGYSVAVQADYKVLLAGQAIQGAAQNNFMVMRYHTGVNISVEEINGLATALQALPNPASETVELRYALTSGDRITINLLDAKGRLASTPINGAFQATGDQRVQLALGDAIAPGAYTITIAGERGVLGSVRFVKE